MSLFSERLVIAAAVISSGLHRTGAMEAPVGYALD